MTALENNIETIDCLMIESRLFSPVNWVALGRL
jgi:hypothetical protein